MRALRCSQVSSRTFRSQAAYVRDGELSVDRIITLPRLMGPSVRGLPAGTGWFTPIDDYCRVPGTEGRVFATGDAADFPVKHGGLGAQQAESRRQESRTLPVRSPRRTRSHPSFAECCSPETNRCTSWRALSEGWAGVRRFTSTARGPSTTGWWPRSLAPSSLVLPPRRSPR